MSFLGALGSIGSGVATGLRVGEEFQTQRLQRSAQEALGKTFAAGQQQAGGQPQPGGPPQGMGGQSPFGGMGAMPQQMNPGQASQPMQQPSHNFGPPGMSAPQLPPQPPGVTGQASGAIAGIESRGSGGYSATGPTSRQGDVPYGKYQVMGKNIPSWTQEVLGRSMSPQEFLANPQAQEAVFRQKFGQLQQKYGPEGAARAWFAGEGGMNTNRTDVNGMTPQAYGAKFMQGMGGGQQPQGQQPPQGQPSSPQGQAGQGSSQISALAQRIQQNNPGIKPGVLWQSLVMAAPMLNHEAQNELKEQTLMLRQQLQTQSEQSRVVLKQMDDFVKTRGQDMNAGNVDKRIDATERGQDLRAGSADARNATTQRGQDMNAASKAATLDLGKEKFAQSQKDAQTRVQLARDKLAEAQKNRDVQASARAQTALNGALDAYAKVMNAGALGKSDPAMESTATGNVANARAGVGKNTPPAPAAPRNEDAPPAEKPPMEGARKAPDGQWYIEKNGQFFKVN